MEQRPLRLGDIVDDYCPRERRITNHAIVALVEETIKQTRCTTCDHEHVYKEAKEPRRRRKDATSALYSQVLSGLQKPMPHAASEDEEIDLALTDEDDVVDVEGEGDSVEAAPAEPAIEAAAPEVEGSEEASEDESEDDPPQPDSNESEIWPMHRRLIRAQLPRTGNEPPPARPIPEFTVRQPGSRSQRQWGRGGQSNGNGNGHHGQGRPRGGQGQGGGGRGRGFAPPRQDGRGGQGGGRPGGGRGRRSR